MTIRKADATIDVRRDVVMYHTVLAIGFDRLPFAVRITTNPTEHGDYAQIVMHKTRSHQCAIQVARYVRRKFEIELAVQTQRVSRPVEAMIGYACADGRQHAPNERTPGWGVFQHIAATPIKDLLREVVGGHNAARTRYVAYEVRGGDRAPLVGITHRLGALQRRYREAPPDTWPEADVHVIGMFRTQDEARAKIGDAPRVDVLALWTRRPPISHLRKILRIEGEDVVWTCDGSSAIRHYATPTICIGPRVHTVYQIRYALEHGVWAEFASVIERRLERT